MMNIKNRTILFDRPVIYFKRQYLACTLIRIISSGDVDSFFLNSLQAFLLQIIFAHNKCCGRVNYLRNISGYTTICSVESEMQTVETLKRSRDVKDGDERSCSWRLERGAPVPAQLHFVPDQLLQSLQNESLAAKSEADFHAVIESYCQKHKWPKGALKGHQLRHHQTCMESFMASFGCRRGTRSIYVNIVLLKPCFEGASANKTSLSGVNISISR
jgi:hypothetical protein